ncbi:hypothetical protein GC169_00815 [bacterium]|nr:hypothetical protein [bacterium]
MRFLLAVVLSIPLIACTEPVGDGSPTLTEAMASTDWQAMEGDAAQALVQRAAESLLSLDRPAALTQLSEAGFECTFGEASSDYPDPAAQCTRGFATRACQMDWEIFTTAENGRVADVEATFVRDCVGTDRDWPTPRRSAIDDQLAPPPPAPN